jgi:hypothetical protein
MLRAEYFNEFRMIFLDARQLHVENFINAPWRLVQPRANIERTPLSTLFPFGV